MRTYTSSQQVIDDIQVVLFPPARHIRQLHEWVKDLKARTKEPEASRMTVDQFDAAVQLLTPVPYEVGPGSVVYSSAPFLEVLIDLFGLHDSSHLVQDLLDKLDEVELSDM